MTELERLKEKLKRQELHFIDSRIENEKTNDEVYIEVLNRAERAEAELRKAEHKQRRQKAEIKEYKRQLRALDGIVEAAKACLNNNGYEHLSDLLDELEDEFSKLESA